MPERDYRMCIIISFPDLRGKAELVPCLRLNSLIPSEGEIILHYQAA